jgi:DNA-binding transcriptional LysR family regulator
MPRRTYYKDVRFEHLRTFCETARRGSFSAAGAAAGLSRATVWQQIDTVEREFGAELFRRRGRGVELTEQGTILLELVQPAVAAVDSVKAAFQARLTGRGGLLRLAVLPGNELRTAITAFRRRFPAVQLILVERRSIDVVRAVESGDCELGFALALPEIPRSPAVHYEPVGRREFLLTAPPRHPLIRARRLTAADLAAHPLILFLHDNPLRRYVERVFERAGVCGRLNVAVETDSIETAEQCVEMGVGVSLGIPPRERTAVAPVERRSLEPIFGALPLCLLWKKGAHLLPHTAAFAETVKAGRTP